MPATQTILRFLSAAFIEDLPLKLVCLVLAALFWFYIDGELADERELTVPVPVAGLRLPEALELAPRRGLPEVRLRVRGPRRRLQYLTPEEVRVDFGNAMQNAQRGLQPVEVRREFFQVPGMDVVSVQPEDLQIELIALATRTLPVRPRMQGEVAPGYRLESYSVAPREVSVTSSEDLEQAQAVLTEPIPIQDCDKDVEIQVGVSRAVLSGGREVEVRSPRKVAVTLCIRRVEISRALGDVPVQALSPPGAAMKVDPGTLSVTVRGPEREVAELRPEDVRLYVEWPGEWDLVRATGAAFPPRSAQVKAIAPSGVAVLGENGKPLGPVRIQGQLARPPLGP